MRFPLPSPRRAAVALAAAALYASSTVLAQEAAEVPVLLEAITVQASAFKRDADALVQPVDVIQGKELDRKRKATLGELLEGEPGVASSDFGPGVGRPIIRGQAGPRVLVLDNGLSTMDAATVSSDHAVTLDAAHAEQVEIIKGPATLIYGSAASAGVVNVVDKRLPERVTPGLSTEAEYSFGENGGDQSGRVELGYGFGKTQLHADFAGRDTRRFDIPGNSNVDGVSGERGRIPNSAVRSQSGALSAARIGEQGSLSGAASFFKTTYGLPAEAEAFIDMQQQRVDLKAVRLNPVAGFSRFSARLGVNDYQHIEFEAPGVPGTRFKNEEQELRLEAEHKPWLYGLRGVLGLQGNHRQFEAIGDEAFVPKTRSEQLGVFVVEEKSFGWGQLEGGLRVEHSDQQPAAATGLAGRDHTPVSVSLGALYNLSADYHLRLTATRSQRAPNAQELFAFGPHLATATFERGSEGLGNETVNNFELGLDKHHGRLGFSLAGYYEAIENYIYLANIDCNQNADERSACTPDGSADRVTPDGSFVADGSTGSGDENLQLVNYQRADAKFYGFEAESSYKLLTGATKLSARVFADLVRGQLDAGGDLPRITPPRIGTGLDASFGSFAANLGYTRVQRQSRVAALETETAGYNLLSADLSYRLEAGAGSATLFLRGRNLLDEEARRHTSFLKNEYPLAGRSLYAGVTLRFN